MSAYEKLPETIRVYVDRRAEALAKRDGLTVEEARELIAGRVRYFDAPKPTHGTGH